jgi:hypothetical protein
MLTIIALHWSLLLILRNGISNPDHMVVSGMF